MEMNANLFQILGMPLGDAIKCQILVQKLLPAYKTNGNAKQNKNNTISLAEDNGDQNMLNPNGTLESPAAVNQDDMNLKMADEAIQNLEDRAFDEIPMDRPSNLTIKKNKKNVFCKCSLADKV